MDVDNGDDDDIASIVADAALKVDGTSVTNSVTMLYVSTLFCCKNDELLPPTARKEEGGANAFVVHVSAAAIIESLAIVSASRCCLVLRLKFPTLRDSKLSNKCAVDWTLNKDPRPRPIEPPQLKRSENLPLQTTKTNNYSHTLDREETFTTVEIHI